MTDRTTATKRRRSDSFSELRDEKGDKPARFERVVRVAAAYSGHEPLIPQEGVKMPGILAREQPVLERLVRRLGA